MKLTEAMTPILTEPEWHLIFDAMNGTITWDSAQMLSGSALR